MSLRCPARVATLLLVMLMSVNMWGADKTIVFNPTDLGGTNSKYELKSGSAGDVDYSSYSYLNTGKYQFNGDKGKNIFFNTSPMPGAIKSIKATKASNTDRSVTAYVSTVALTSSNYSTKGTSLGAKDVTSNGTIWTLTDEQIAAGYKYFYLHYSTTSALYVSQFEVTYVSAPAVVRTVAWMVNNETYTAGNPTTQVNDGDAVTTLPTAPTTDCGGKTFVGWTATADYSHATAAPDDLFSTAANAPAVSGGDVTYYAVFADASEGGTASQTQKFTYSSHSGWTINSCGDNSSGSYYILKKGGSIVSPTFDVSNITQITANCRTYGGSNYKTIDVKCGTTSLGTITAGGNSLNDANITFASPKPSLSGTKSLTFSSSTTSDENGPGVSSITITYSAPSITYSNYTTTCETQYEIDYLQSTGGEISGPDKSAADKMITLSYEVTPGYQFDGWTVLDGEAKEITVTDNLFKMPASDVEVEGSFSCATPTFKTNLSTTPVEVTQGLTAPTLTVAANETYTINYQWQSSTDQADWSNIGTNSASYATSSATVGTTYFRCLLKNGVSPCETFATSNVATVTVNAPSKCETPTFSLAEGTYTGAQSVTLSCLTPEAKIYYTTDGTAPSTLSTEYTGAINVFKTMTIRAIAAKDNVQNSDENSILYTIQYTVTFNMQSHGSQVADQKVGYEDPVSKPATTSITGWTFGGWYKEGACTNQWDFTTDKVTGHTILYAKWTETKFDVNFYVNGTPNKVSIQEGKKVIDNAPTPAAFDQDFQTFVGWAEKSIDGIAPSKPDLITDETVTGEANYYAVFGDAKLSNTYSKITNQADLADGNYIIVGYYDYSFNKYYQMKNELLNKYYMQVNEVDVTNTFTNPDRAYIWKLQKSNNNTWSIYNEDISKYVYLYKSDSFYDLGLRDAADYFTINVNNGDWSIKSTTYTNYYLTYTYASNHDEFAALDSHLYPTHLFKQDVEATGYITNKTNRVTLHYDANAGTEVIADVPENARINKNEEFTLPTDELTRTGYTHLGWNESNTATEPQATITPTEDVTVYAVWQVKTTTITLSQAEATTPGTTQVTATWNQPMPEATMPQRDHYQFAGYKHNNTLYYNADGSSAKNWDKEFATATLTAQWTINKHNIILPAVLAGGSLIVSTGISDVSYDATVTITANPNDHYTLTALTYQVGENTPVSIKDNPSFQMPDADVTIAAEFTEDPKRTISWSVGGSIAATTNDVYDGTAFATIKAQAPNVGDNAAGDCADKFMGWAIAPINTQGGIDKDAVQWADEATTSETQNTFYAVFAKGEMSGVESYILVESALTDYSGDYLIVYNNTNAMNTHYGNQNANTYATYTNISSYYTEDTKSIASNTTTDDLVYRAAKTDNGYSLYCVSDESYLGIASGTTGTGSKLRWNTSYTESADDWTLGVGSIGNVGSNTLYIRWNNNNSSYRFAAYASNGQQAIQLFKKTQIVTYGHYITQCCTTPDNPLAITNTDLTVKMGGTLPLSIGETGNGNTNITWASKNGAVATVDQNGKVTPVSTGKATITVSQEAKDGYCAQSAEVEIEVIASDEFSIAFAAADGGTTEAKVNDTPTNKATKGTTVTITATPADDYNFTGWTVNAGGVTLADASEATTTFEMGSADVEITPSFAIKQYTITLNAGNGTIEGGSIKELKNQDIHSKITLPNAVACNSDEWEFKGWATSSVEETTNEPTFVSSTEYEVTDNATLYAVYGQTTTVDGDYKYKIYAQVGDNKKYMKGVPVASSSEINQVLSGAETDAQTYTLVTIDASADKYALKYLDNETVKYLCINTSGSGSNKNYNIQGTETLADNSYWIMSDGAKGGKIFTNVEYEAYGLIYRNADASKIYDVFKAYKTPSSKVTVAGTEYYDLNLQQVGREQKEGGVWNSNPSCAHHYQVTYDGNGATTTCVSEKLEEGEITICADEPSLAGYTFAGWNDGAATYAAGASYNLTAPVTFTAVWNPIKVTAITLNVTEPQTLNWKSDAATPTFQLSVASTTPEFVADNSVTWSVSEGTAVSVSATGLVTALEAGTAIVTATANDGSGVTASCTFTVTKTYKLTITDTEGVYNIKANGSTTKNQYYEVNEVITLSGTTKNGYIFGEWVVMQGETPITVTDDKFTMPAAEVTVTATFTTKKDYYVDDMNDNAQIVMEGKYTVPSLPDVVTPSSSNSCEQTHLYFVGWIEDEIDEGQPDVPTGLITAGEEKTAGEKTYHAVWAEDSNNNQ